MKSPCLTISSRFLRVALPGLVCALAGSLAEARADDASAADDSAPAAAAVTRQPDGSPPAVAATSPPGVADASPPTVADTAANAAREAAYGEFKQLFDTKQYERAVASAQKVVTLTEEQGPKNGEELQVALMNLAVTQTLAGAPDAAEASYLRVIQMMESEGAMSSPRLARAQAGLAVAYHDSGRHDVAAERFERAIMMNRRNDGLFNDGQLPLLDKYADSLTMLDRIEDAHNVVRYGVRVVERKYGASSIEIVPRLEVAARWYTRVGAYDMAKAYLRRAIDIAERADGPNSAALVGPLTALAENYRRQMLAPVQQDSSASSADPQRATTSFESSTVPSDNQWQEAWFAGRERRDSDGERALTRALQIAEGQPKPSQAQIADVRTQLGDWYQTRLQQDKALTAYQRAWAAAQQVHMGDVTLADQLFAKPVLLHYVRPTEWDRYARRPPDQVTAHTVEIKLTVGDDGRVRDPSVVANDGSDKMAKAALEAVESARYRPRMVDGRPLTTPDVKFAQVFFEPLPQATAAPAAPATGKASDRS